MSAANGKPDSLAAAVAEVSDRMSVLVREEIELAKAEVTAKATRLARGTAAVAAGALVGFFALIFGLLALAWGINEALSSMWIGFIVVFGLLVVLGIGAALFAWRMFRASTPPTPTMAIDEAKKIRETVSSGSEGG